MLASLLECVADPEIASTAHRYSKWLTTDRMQPDWKLMQNSANPGISAVIIPAPGKS